jgi:hypothetical protein
MALNLTQLVGATAFLVAALACLRTGLRCGHGLWYAIAALLLALALEVVCGVRYRAHDLANSLLALEETYGARQSIQHLLLITVLVVTAAVLLIVLKLRSIAVAARLAIIVAVALVGLFMVETVSLHDIDAVLYASKGLIARIAWIWVAGACLIATCAVACSP